MVHKVVVDGVRGYSFYGNKTDLISVLAEALFHLMKTKSSLQSQREKFCKYR